MRAGLADVEGIRKFSHFIDYKWCYGYRRIALKGVTSQERFQERSSFQNEAVLAGRDGFRFAAGATTVLMLRPSRIGGGLGYFALVTATFRGGYFWSWQDWQRYSKPVDVSTFHSRNEF